MRFFYFTFMATTKSLTVHSDDTDNSLSVFINIHNNITLSFEDSILTVFCFENEEDVQIFIDELKKLKKELYGTSRKK